MELGIKLDLQYWISSGSNILLLVTISLSDIKPRGGSRAAATSKMEHFVIIVNGLQPFTIITKHSIFDVAAALDPPLQPS